MRSENDPLIAIGEIARRSGVAASALRYYETLGLIEAVRAGSGHRRYRRSALRRIAFVVFAQRVGFTLEEIAAQLVGLPSGHVPTGGDWKRLSSQWRKRVEERIAELQRLNISLDQCIGCGCLSLKRCWLSNPGDRAGLAGPGARRWLGDSSVV